MNSLEFTVEPTGSYDLELVSLVLRRSPNNRIDHMEGGHHRRLLDVGLDEPVLASIRQSGEVDNAHLHITLTGNFPITGEIKRVAYDQLSKLLGFRVDLSEFFAIVARRNEKLAPLAARLAGLKPQQYPTFFEGILNCICCQQVSLASGLAVLGRLAEAFGPSLTVDGKTYFAIPRPVQIASLTPNDLRLVGLSQRKSEYLINIAQAMVEGRLDEEELNSKDNVDAFEKLMSIRGLGRWSAHYLLLRGLGRLDTFPIDDIGAARSLARWLQHEDYRLPAWQVEEIVSSWDPYRGMLYFYLVAWKRLQKAGRWHE